MRAATPVLPGEDAAGFEARLTAWTADLQPGDDVERFLVRRAVQLSWQLERADRSVSARAAAARGEADDRLTGLAEEVATLGRRLFWNPLGPLALYPNATLGWSTRAEISWSRQPQDPDDPARLVVRLEATALGCAWMLDRWAELREALEGGRAWLGADRFRAIRLLGRQPLDASEDDRVRALYRACWAIRPDGECAYADVQHELGPVVWERWLDRLARREVAGDEPMDEATARAALEELIGSEEERLEGLLARHLEREGPSALGEPFDASVDGERLRRYQAACDRALLRVLEALKKSRKDDERTQPAPRRPVVPKEPGLPDEGVSRTTQGPCPPAPSGAAAAANEANDPGPAASPGETPDSTNEAIEPTPPRSHVPTAIVTAMVLLLAGITGAFGASQSEAERPALTAFAVRGRTPAGVLPARRHPDCVPSSEYEVVSAIGAATNRGSVPYVLRR